MPSSHRSTRTAWSSNAEVHRSRACRHTGAQVCGGRTWILHRYFHITSRRLCFTKNSPLSSSVTKQSCSELEVPVCHLISVSTKARGGRATVAGRRSSLPPTSYRSSTEGSSCCAAGWFRHGSRP
ncbi:hypothetical protein BHE74_00003797 [Ensete ventricosum]|nr:hypothetical protein GW17_00012263 [Ensete ventricosum]RWW87386.1 hypothetical protein BHE74_00003797 [Ensete ventricosum]